ncbi:MAG: hypothetical protein ACAI34_10670 [Verrucomicrobium sp.]
MSLKEEWSSLQVKAMHAAITPEHYVKACARVDWLAYGMLMAFRDEVWLPWARNAGIKVDQSKWTTEPLDDFDGWVAQFTDWSDYPWQPFLKRYEEARQAGDRAKEAGASSR